jgi:molybdopterin converting factor small subunit
MVQPPLQSIGLSIEGQRLPMAIKVSYIAATAALKKVWGDTASIRCPYLHGDRIDDLIRRLELNTGAIAIVTRNGKVCRRDAGLKDGDEIVLFPVAAGG